MHHVDLESEQELKHVCVSRCLLRLGALLCQQYPSLVPMSVYGVGEFIFCTRPLSSTAKMKPLRWRDIASLFTLSIRPFDCGHRCQDVSRIRALRERDGERRPFFLLSAEGLRYLNQASVHHLLNCFLPVSAPPVPGVSSNPGHGKLRSTLTGPSPSSAPAPAGPKSSTPAGLSPSLPLSTHTHTSLVPWPRLTRTSRMPPVALQVRQCPTTTGASPAWASLQAGLALGRPRKHAPAAHVASLSAAAALSARIWPDFDEYDFYGRVSRLLPKRRCPPRSRPALSAISWPVTK